MLRCSVKAAATIARVAPAEKARVFGHQMNNKSMAKAYNTLPEEMIRDLSDGQVSLKNTTIGLLAKLCVSLEHKGWCIV